MKSSSFYLSLEVSFSISSWSGASSLLSIRLNSCNRDEEKDTYRVLWIQLRWEALFSQNSSLQAQVWPLQPPLPICHSLCSTAWSFFSLSKEGNLRRGWFFPQGKGGGDNVALKREHCLQCSYLNKKYKVLERSVKVCLFLQLDHRVKVLVVDVSVNSEETLENRLGHWHEVLWEWYAWEEENRCLFFNSQVTFVCFESHYNPDEISFNSRPLSLHRFY